MKKILLVVLLLVFPSICLAQEETKEARLSIKEKYDLAIQYFLKKDYAKAHNTFSEIAKEEQAPFSAIVYFNMGMCLQVNAVNEKENIDDDLYQALLEQAAVYYQKVQEIVPYFVQIYSNGGLIAHYRNQPRSAVDEMINMAQKLTDEIGAFPPDMEGLYSYRSYEALLSIAQNYIATGDYSNAVKLLRDIVSQMEKTPPGKEYLRYTAYNSLGYGLFNLGDSRGAIQNFETSIKIAPAQPKLDLAYSNLGMLYFKEGDYSSAREAVNQALAINPNNETALDYRDKLKAASGN